MAEIVETGKTLKLASNIHKISELEHIWPQYIFTPIRILNNVRLYFLHV